MMSMTPTRKSALPMASSCLSKKNATPSTEKVRPKAVRPMPILRRSLTAKGDAISCEIWIGLPWGGAGGLLMWLIDGGENVERKRS